jgi:DNA-binding MarR family transcriptional regulator
MQLLRQAVPQGSSSMRTMARKPKPSQTELARSEECASRVLDVAPMVVRELRKRMRTHRMEGMSVPQFRAMALLYHSPKATLSAVADHVGSSLPAASRMIDGLVARGMVARHECTNDRRQVSLALTPRGAGAFRTSRDFTRRQLTELFSATPQRQQQMIIAGMNALAGIFGSKAEQSESASKKF